MHGIVRQPYVRRGVTIGVLAAMVLVTAIGSAAASSAEPPQINGCVSVFGVLRVLKSGQSCQQIEMPISWAVRGAQGPAGPQGVVGKDGAPGPAGPVGPAGAGINTLADLNGISCAVPTGTAGVLAVTTADDGTVHLACHITTPPPTQPPVNTATLSSFTTVAPAKLGSTQAVATITLSAPAGADVFVAVSSSQPDVADVAGGGAHIPPGSTVGQVLVTGVSLSGVDGVVLTATLGSLSLQTSVVVIA